MLKNISLGVYIPGNTFVHRLQARTKILLLLGCALWVVLASLREWRFAPYIAVLTSVTLATALAHVTPAEIWRRLRFLFLLLALTSVFSLSSQEGDKRTLAALGPLVTSYGTMRQVLLIGALAIMGVLLASLLPWMHVLHRRLNLKRARILLLLTLMIALVAFWMLSGSTPTTRLPIGPYIITYAGVWTLFTFAMVLLVFFTFSVLLTLTTSPVALIEGLNMLLAPLRLLKLPVDDFSLMALLALRFIPTLLEEVEMLLKAQTARGADVRSGSARERLQSLSMLFIPLVRNTLRRAADLSVALEARGYAVKGRQTRLYETTFGWRDYLAFGVVLVAAVITLLI